MSRQISDRSKYLNDMYKEIEEDKDSSKLFKTPKCCWSVRWQGQHRDS